MREPMPGLAPQLCWLTVRLRSLGHGFFCCNLGSVAPSSLGFAEMKCSNLRKAVSGSQQAFHNVGYLI